MSEVDKGYWAVLELLGHVKVAGYITEEEAFGSKLGRIDIPSPAGGVLLTQFFGGASVYRITPTTEAVARAYAAATNAEPISLYELELPARAHTHELGLNWHESGPVEYCATCKAAREVAGWSDDLVDELIAGMKSDEPSAEDLRALDDYDPDDYGVPF